MTDSQVTELEQSANSSMSSNTIEWALNFRICDLVQANPSLTPTLMRLLVARLRSTASPVPVLLALSLLEIVAKNCGLVAVKFFDEELMDALMALVKRKEGWKYSLGRNMYKTFGASTMVGTIDEGSKDMWAQASMKVREMLQLWTDAFLLQQGQLRPVFTAYKRLRQEGYTFPELKQGASAEIALMKGAEESPAFLASGGTVSESPEPRRAETPSTEASPSGHSSAVLSQLPPDIRAEILAASAAADAPQEASPSAPPQPAGPRINLTPATVEATRDLCRELRELHKDPSSDVQRLDELRLKATSAREEATRQIQKLMTSQSGGSERFVESLMLLLDDLNDVLPSQDADQSSAGASPAQAPSALPQADLLDLNPVQGGEAAADGGSSSSAPLPPPPEEAPPDREQQELYDEVLARYLQERENEAFAVNEDEDAALALRLSLEEFGGDADAMARYGGNAGMNAAEPNMVSCGQCRAVNQLERGGSGLFICYACGITQQTPGQPAQSSRPRPAAPVPTRHAPPARVICAPGASELIIGGGGAAPAETPSTGGYVPPSLAGASGAPLAVQSFEGMGNQALLGAPPKSSKAWKMSMPSFAAGGGGSSSYSTVKDLGDGGAASEYVSMGDGEEGFSMLGGSAPPGKNSTSSGLVRGMLNWGKKKGADRGERVQVSEEWELIRPADQRPYYFNSQTQASQWQPPDVISSNTGLLSGMG